MMRKGSSFLVLDFLFSNFSCYNFSSGVGGIGWFYCFGGSNDGFMGGWGFSLVGWKWGFSRVLFLSWWCLMG